METRKKEKKSDPEIQRHQHTTVTQHWTKNKGDQSLTSGFFTNVLKQFVVNHQRQLCNSGKPVQVNMISGHQALLQMNWTSGCHSSSGNSAQTLKSLKFSSVRKWKSQQSSVGGTLGRVFPRHPRRSTDPGPPDNTKHCVQTRRERPSGPTWTPARPSLNIPNIPDDRKKAGEPRPLPESGRYHRDSSHHGFHSNVKKTEQTKIHCDPHSLCLTHTNKLTLCNPSSWPQFLCLSSFSCPCLSLSNPL